MRIVIERKDSDGILHIPYKYPNGKFRMADGIYGKEKHRAQNAIEVANEREIILKLIEGYHLRMAPRGRTDADLIAPQNITVRFEKIINCRNAYKYSSASARSRISATVPLRRTSPPRIT
jgi:hypothetical protein